MPYVAIDPTAATVLPDPVPNPAAPVVGGGGITLGAARTELRAMLEGRTDIAEERLTFWLNRAYVDLATSMKKEDVLKYSMDFEFVEGQPFYLLPGLTVTTLNVSLVDEDNQLYGGAPLAKTDLSDYRRRKDIEGRPTHFFRMNRVLVVWPTPDSGYGGVLDFRFEPMVLVNDVDEPVLRGEWHEAWLSLARKKVLSAASEWEASLAAQNEFVQHVRVRQDREGAEEENKVVRSSAPRNEIELRRRSMKRKWWHLGRIG